MSTQFLTIKEAAEKYKKAEITIRRYVRSVVSESNSADREHIHPSPAEVKKLKSKKKPFSYSVSAELLQQKFAEAKKGVAKKKASAAADAESTDSSSALASILQDQLKVKDEQIRSLNSALDGLSERQRETNILMKGLQEQLLLGSGSKESWWQFWK